MKETAFKQLSDGDEVVSLLHIFDHFLHCQELRGDKGGKEEEKKEKSWVYRQAEKKEEN